MSIKNCTDLPQSKKLIELGLDVNTSDMCYPRGAFDPDWDKEPVCHSCGGIGLALPAWSLAALLELMPEELPEDYFLTIWKEKNEFGCCHENCNGDSFHSFFGKTALDAAFEMVCWLLKNKLI